MLISLLSAAIKVQSPVVIKYAVDVLISEDAVATAAAEGTWTARWIPDLLTACLAVIGIRFFEAICRYLSGIMKSIAVEKTGERLRNRLFRKIQSYSFETHGQNQTGELIQRSTSDVETYLEFYRGQVDEIGRLAFIVVASIWIMWEMSALLLLVPLSVFPIVALMSLRFNKKTTAIFENVDKKEAIATGIAQETISGIRVVRAFGNENYELRRYGVANDNVRDELIKMGRSFSLYFSTTDFLTIMQITGTLFFGGLMVISDTITIGTLLAFLMYCEWLSWPLKQLARMIMRIGKAFVSVRRIDEILSLPSDEEDGTCRPVLHGEIVYDNVSFSYSDTEGGIRGEESGGAEASHKHSSAQNTKVLDGISFRIGAGQTLGILGHTGSGKSTLVMLLQRLMEYEGSIRIDGVELRDIEKTWIRNHVGLVLQEPYLFSKTVKENINILRAHGDEEIERAARISDIHSNIESFKSGYETMVGERGAQLSGGQKQRISIARTVIDDKKILIFDDSLSAVDSETDLSIRKALDETKNDATRIIISHRVTTVMGADLILVLKQGKILESGTHETLKDAGGLYQKLWEIQTSED
ncbi:MAG: ABC transporter ATP-binding protein [Bacillota bacterium]|nr:ABC transporter ATP-binding protein [Bacillota bacterium]